MKIVFKCDVCKTEPEVLWMKGQFGENPDKKEYCETCFKKRYPELHSQPEQLIEEQKTEQLDHLAL